MVNREGKELTEHPTLPSKEMQERMDELIDSMDLMEAEEEGGLDGGDGPWFRTEESFNPAIHLIKDAVSWRVFHPDDKFVPKAHPEVEKYLERPQKVTERSRDVAKRCRELFDLEYGESKSIWAHDSHNSTTSSASEPTVAMRKAAKRAEARPEDRKAKEVNLEGVMDEELAEEERARQAEAKKGGASSAPVNGEHSKRSKEERRNSAGSDTDEEEALVLGNEKKSVEPSREDASKESEESRTSTLNKADAIADFEKRLEEKEAELSPVFEDMEKLIKTTISKSFSSNDYGKARNYLAALRKAAVEVSFVCSRRCVTYTADYSSMTQYEEAPRYNE